MVGSLRNGAGDRAIAGGRVRLTTTAGAHGWAWNGYLRRSATTGATTTR
ncbi:hypothetical protein [Nonomuraea sp. NPDC003201]